MSTKTVKIITIIALAIALSIILIKIAPFLILLVVAYGGFQVYKLFFAPPPK